MNSAVCLLTAYNSTLSAIASLSIPHMKEYAGRHGYGFRVIQYDDCDRKGGWIKIEPIRAMLAAGFDFVFWMDTDTLVVRKDVDIRIAARPDADIHMAWHDQVVRLGDPAHFNAGIMLIRSSDWARHFFMRVWDTGPVQQHKWEDQATIMHLLGYDDVLQLGAGRPDEPSRKRIATLDTAWNSIIGIEVADDPIIHHYAGISDYEVRLGLMRADDATLDRRIKETPEFRRAFLKQLGQWRHAAVRVTSKQIKFYLICLIILHHLSLLLSPVHLLFSRSIGRNVKPPA